ncbi:hypothetical protein VNO78_18524 [Psophocarpus tetragonolobus]|uniref:Uncharacterized protein n=1 Tax=Psophocarpus tetragonolobus TaxID=3891 RepID=A0AAN9SJH9_PSOTE
MEAFPNSGWDSYIWTRRAQKQVAGIPIGWTGHCSETHASGSTLNANIAPESGKLNSYYIWNGFWMGGKQQNRFSDMHVLTYWNNYHGSFVAGPTNVHVK